MDSTNSYTTIPRHMRKTIFTLLAACGLTLGAQADEGMWLMEQLAKKYPTLVSRGIQLKEYDLYNPNGTSLKDAVVSFDGGCTGEIISSQGLVLTNHHCGYDAIQQLSSVEHNYLEQGYWAKSFAEELPAKGVVVTFIDRIEDVTPYVLSELKKVKKGTGMEFLSPKYLNGLAQRKYAPIYAKGQAGIELEIKPFYNGNKYLLFVKKVYSDIRFVGAPPSAIGKFGADTDNWRYPRHTGDFSIFRIYADANGNPAPYSEHNIPLRPKRWFNISTSGVEKGDFAMIMGFPGRTNHYALPSEIKEWREIDNDIRIRMRGIRQEVMLREMLADPKINIMYAAKYARSQNGHKRAIGANWGISRLGFTAPAERLQSYVQDWAQRQTDKKVSERYTGAIRDIDRSIEERANMRRQLWYLDEGIYQAIEATRAPGLDLQAAALSKYFKSYCNEDYSPSVDAKIALAVLTEYTAQVDRKDWPQALADGLQKYGTLEAYVNALFTQSAFTSEEGYARFAKLSEEEQKKALAEDPLAVFATSVRGKLQELREALRPYDTRIDRARRDYLEGYGLANKAQGTANGLEDAWPDANSTLRFTFGEIKGYSPADGVEYHVPTTLEGVMQKENPKSWEFAVPNRLKEVYQQKLYGENKRWAIKKADGSYVMPVNFCATTHTTGGNSGSPVFNKYGHLIGINFDRNWEGVAGDINYLPDYQRSIICDIRYILLIIDEVGGARRLIDELTLVSDPK